MAGDDYTRNYAALASLYDEWAQGEPGRYALVTAGAVQRVYHASAEARRELQNVGAGVTNALVVALWPLEGWRHPRFVVESYRRHGGPPPATTVPADPPARDVLLRDFLLAERLRRDDPAPEDLAAPYLLIKDGVLLGHYRRVTQARQAVDAAMPPLAPVVFTSLRPGQRGPLRIMTLQALVDALPRPAH